MSAMAVAAHDPCPCRAQPAAPSRERRPARLRTRLPAPAYGHESDRVAARRAALAELETSDDAEQEPAGEPGDGEAVDVEPAPDGALPDEHPGELWDTLNGKTGCTLPGGIPFSEVLTTKCHAGCTAEHEALHFADIKPCCAKAGAAHAKAADDDARKVIETSFGSWLVGNDNWLECRAYTKSVKCADKILAAKKCWKEGMAPGDSACCRDTTRYRSSSESLREARCNNAPAALTPCPFP